MAIIKSAKDIAAKWKTVTPTRSGYYKDGVLAPRKDWAEQTAAAKDNYNAGIQKSITEDRFSKGVKEAGTQKWKDKTTSVGVSRWQGGVQVAAADFEKGFAPYRDVIEKTALPPRYPKGDPRNYDRVAVLGAALNKYKTGS